MILIPEDMINNKTNGKSNSDYQGDINMAKSSMMPLKRISYLLILPQKMNKILVDFCTAG